MTTPQTEPKKKSAPITSVSLIPDASILMQARVAVGDHRTLKLRDVANLLLHDPVLTMEFLQSANSTLYGGAPVLDLEGALTRLGSVKISEQLLEISLREKNYDDEVGEMCEVLRYNARRASIVSLIIASAIRPALANQVRLAGLFAEAGHMAVLMHLGTTYCTVAKANNRKMLPFRLEKDHKINVDSVRTQYLKAKGIPAKILVPYDQEMDLKSSSDVDVRACVRSSIELIEAFDNGKILNYSPDKPTPSQSNLRLLQVTPFLMEKIYKAVTEYLKRIAVTEEPEGASVFLQSAQEESSIDINEGAKDQIKVPNYPAVIVKPKSQERIQPLCDLCAQEQNESEIKSKSVQILTSSGFFQRAALIRIPANSDDAIIEYSSGFDATQAKKITITDPLSPFKLFRLRIKSFNSESAKPSAPFGVSSFAVGPVAMLAEGERLVLYADTAGGKGLNMDLRGVFRLSMSLLSTRFQA